MKFYNFDGLKGRSRIAKINHDFLEKGKPKLGITICHYWPLQDKNYTTKMQKAAKSTSPCLSLSNIHKTLN